jgi:hypothetical protein
MPGHNAAPRWTVCSQPFKHAIIHDALSTVDSASLSRVFEHRMNVAASGDASYANYDARIRPLKSADFTPFKTLLAVDHLRRLARALQLEATLEVDSACHAHPAGSRSGWLHNDYNPGWFSQAASGDDLVFSGTLGCDYRTGKCIDPNTKPVVRMRYLTMIYFLNNPTWKPGMGGETGLYLGPSQSVDAATIWIPPINNTMLLFECTPHSWHSFRSCTFQRNSITLWLHRDTDSAKRQWPHHSPVGWT